MAAAPGPTLIIEYIPIAEEQLRMSGVGRDEADAIVQAWWDALPADRRAQRQDSVWRKNPQTGVIVVFTYDPDEDAAGGGTARVFRVTRN